MPAKDVVQQLQLSYSALIWIQLVRKTKLILDIFAYPLCKLGG